MSQFNEQKNDEIINRLLSILDISTLGTLGKKLGYANGNAISNWKNRGVDLNKIQEYYPEISLDYLLYGIGRSTIDIDQSNTKKTQPFNSSGRLIELQNSINEMFNLFNQLEELYKIRKYDSQIDMTEKILFYEGIISLFRKQASRIK